MGTTSKAASSSSKNNNEYEKNPRWRGYLYILIGSLVNWASVSNVDEDWHADYQGSRSGSLVFGIITFALVIIILVYDNCQSFFWKHCIKSDDNDEKNVDKYNFTKAMDGKAEGGVLLFFTLWWIIGYVYYLCDVPK